MIKNEAFWGGFLLFFYHIFSERMINLWLAAARARVCVECAELGLWSRWGKCVWFGLVLSVWSRTITMKHSRRGKSGLPFQINAPSFFLLFFHNYFITIYQAVHPILSCSWCDLLADFPVNRAIRNVSKMTVCEMKLQPFKVTDSGCRCVSERVQTVFMHLSKIPRMVEQYFVLFFFFFSFSAYILLHTENKMLTQ